VFCYAIHRNSKCVDVGVAGAVRKSVTTPEYFVYCGHRRNYRALNFDLNTTGYKCECAVSMSCQWGVTSIIRRHFLDRRFVNRGRIESSHI